MMSPADILFRLQRFLLCLSIVLFLGTVVELLLVKHWEDAVQIIPFVLCGLGAIAALLLLFRPRRATVLSLRLAMALVICGSLFGIYEHFVNNFAFQREIKPDASMTDVLINAIAGGNPLLAPGTMAVAALLALAATYYHPVMQNLSEGDAPASGFTPQAQ
jgi:hypothetical protein